MYTDIKALSDKDCIDLNLLTLHICGALEIDANGAVDAVDCSRTHEEALRGMWSFTVKCTLAGPPFRVPVKAPILSSAFIFKGVGSRELDE